MEGITLQCTEGFLIPKSFHSTSLATWGSSWVSKEAKFITEFDFLGFRAVFQPELKNIQKCPKLSQIVLFWGGFLKFFQF